MASAPEVAGSFYAPMPDDICDREGCTPEIQAILRALICFAREGNDHPTREKLMIRAQVKSLHWVVKALKWLPANDAIEVIADSSLKTGRRFRPLWTLRRGRFVRVEPGPGEATHKRPGARPHDGGARPDDVDVIPDDGGARPDVAPLPNSLNRDPDREKTDVPSVDVGPSIAPEAPARETGPDGTVSLRSGGGGGEPEGEVWQGPDPTPGQLADWEAAARRPRSPESYVARARLADWARELARRAAPPGPAPPRPRPSSFVPGVAHGPPPKAGPGRRPRGRGKIARDDRYPLAEALALVRSLDDPDSPFDTPYRLAVHLAGRFRDASDATIDFYRKAATRLGAGQFEALVLQADAPRIDDPAVYLSTKLAEAMADNRRAGRAKKTPASVHDQVATGGGPTRHHANPAHRTQGFTPCQ